MVINVCWWRACKIEVNPNGVYDQAFLDSMPAVEETRFLRHVRFEHPLVIKMDGKRNLGVVLKPKEADEAD